MLIYILFSLLKYNILFGAHKQTLAYLLRRRYILKIAFLNLTSQAVQRPADKKKISTKIFSLKVGQKVPTDALN